MRQAFEALQHVPPMQYIAPGAQSDAAERENVTYEQLVGQPVLFNPFLSRGEPRRATREEEADMVRWAQAGITGEACVSGGRHQGGHAGGVSARSPGPRVTRHCVRTV